MKKPKPEADRLLRRRCMFTKASCRRYAILKGFYLPQRSRKEQREI